MAASSLECSTKVTLGMMFQFYDGLDDLFWTYLTLP